MPSLNRASTLIADDRASGRYRLLLEARAGEAGAGESPVVLHDLSQDGLLFEAEAGIGNGAEIMLDIPNVGPVAARTVWTNGSFYGAEFATPLTPERLKAALAASVVAWPDFASKPLPDLEEIRSQRARPKADAAQSDDAHGPVAQIAGQEDSYPKLPLPVRIRIIVGLSLALWTAILGLAWLALG